nr:retrovirus-related Pol polyprotein from transposon TNT 1-94 [Tanacetum cinerariifolium]
LPSELGYCTGELSDSYTVSESIVSASCHLVQVASYSSDTRPPMLNRTDFASWQQPIRLYYRGKENDVNILKSIDEGPFQMGTYREIQAEGTEGESIHDYYVWFAKLINDMRNIKMTMSRMQLNSKFVNNMLPEWGRFVTAVKLNRGLRNSNYDQLYAYLKQHEFKKEGLWFRMFRVDRTEVRGTLHGVKVQLVMGEHRTELRMLIQVKQGRLSATTTTENGVALDEEQLLFLAGGLDNTINEDVDEQPIQDLALNVDNVFQADDCDDFDSDVDEAPTVQTMFMPNLSFVDPVYDEAGPSYDSDILSESVFETTRNNVVDNSLTAELATYKEQVELYERRARFELTEREQKIDEQLRIVITDRNIKE